ncbi:MAG: hypothetical protein ACRDNT_04410 [Streptosporangiaceae bacterium]
MTGPVPADPAGQPPPDDLTARVFRALYQQFDLYTVAGTHIAVPKGTPCYAAASIGEIARQISDHEHQDPPPPVGTLPRRG